MVHQQKGLKRHHARAIQCQNLPKRYCFDEAFSKQQQQKTFVELSCFNQFNFLTKQTPAAIDNYYIVPVCYQRSSADLSGQTSWATGWGTLFSGGSLSRYNMQVAMPVLTDARCKQRFGANLDPRLGICAGEVGNNLDTCQVRDCDKLINCFVSDV